jgi:hypothetical protein
LTQDAASTNTVVPFPCPQTFDIIPLLHTLLVHLLSAPSNPPPPTSTAAEAVTGGPSATAAIASLDPKTLLTKANSVRKRIRGARATVEGLPDIDRSVAEQEDEILELEQRIQRLKAVTREFGQRSANPANH